MNKIMLVQIEDYAGAWDSDKMTFDKKSKKFKPRLVQKYCYTTRTPKKKFNDNIKATIRLPKHGDRANAHESNVIGHDKHSKYGFSFNENNMAEGVIYGFWYHGIVFNAIKLDGKIYCTPTEKGVR